ncbi:hypothetical protein OAA19_02450 [Rubripirellula sp.]|nr:hypothetical protein [Rubripirellula sp.]MDB4338950.1 hypothetical protein [Rubripirellula sp.]
MESSNVTNIDSLESFHRGILQLSHEIRTITEEIRASVVRAEEFFTQEQPSYWRQQTKIAEQSLNEAKEQLAAKTATARPNDRPAASEERKRVYQAERRLAQCNEKQLMCKKWSFKISKQCDELLGPMADILDHCDAVLPQAAAELRGLVGQLRSYAEQAEKPL